jgi:hypothetical protein
MHFKCHLWVISYLKGRSRIVRRFFIAGGLIRTIFEHNINIKTATGHAKILFTLSLPKADRNVGKLTKWVSLWKQFMLQDFPEGSRRARHEPLLHVSTAVFRFRLVQGGLLSPGTIT